MPPGQRWCALIERVGHAVELARLLEGRVDQHQPAPFLGRQLRAERQPAVELQHPRLDVAGEELPEFGRILWMKLDREQPVLLAQKAAARSAASRDRI